MHLLSLTIPTEFSKIPYQTKEIEKRKKISKENLDFKIDLKTAQFDKERKYPDHRNRKNILIAERRNKSHLFAYFIKMKVTVLALCHAE